MDNRSRLARSAGRPAYPETSPFQAAEPEPLLTRASPVSAQLPRYRVPSARRELVAGVTVEALALPAAMAYAEVAGLSPVSEIDPSGPMISCLDEPNSTYATVGSRSA
jgi:hypothetical protein